MKNVLNVENDPALLSVVVEPSGIASLRVDVDLFAQDPAASDSVEVFRLEEIQAIQPDLSVLMAGIGRVVHVYVHEEGASNVVQIHLDFAVDPIELRCSRLTRSFEPYTAGDFAAKVRLLTSLYLDAADACDASESELVRLRSELGSLVAHEMRVGEEKSSFFEKVNPSKAAALRQSLRLLRQIQSRLLLREGPPN